MKPCCLAVALLLTAAALVACGGGSSNPATAVTGNWNITLTTQTDTGGTFPPGTFIMTLVPGSCSISVNTVRVFTAKGSSCSFADNTGGSRLSGSGSFYGTPEKVVIGASPSGQVDVLFLEADPGCCSAMILFDGTGTVSNGAISGTWTCVDNPSNACQPGELFGTFNGSKQQ